MINIDIDALAEEVTSAANIVTNDGYYEIDMDAVAKCLDKARATAPLEARIALLEGALGEAREALEAIAIGSARRRYIGSKYAGLLARNIARNTLASLSAMLADDGET